MYTISSSGYDGDELMIRGDERTDNSTISQASIMEMESHT